MGRLLPPLRREAGGGRMTHEERVKHHMYETLEGIAEQSERIASLEELVADMWAYITEPVGKRNNLKERLARFDDIADRMRELGVAE